MGQEPAFGKPLLDEALTSPSASPSSRRAAGSTSPTSAAARASCSRRRPARRPRQALLASRSGALRDPRAAGSFAGWRSTSARSARHPPFRRLFFGQTISTFGSEITTVAVPFQLYQLTHSTLQVGLLALCELFPLLTLPIVGGAVADAVDRRSCCSHRGALAVVTLGLRLERLARPASRLGDLRARRRLAMSIFSLGVAGMTSRSRGSSPEDELAAAIAIEDVYCTRLSVAGPGARGPADRRPRPHGRLLLDAATFGASLWSVWRLPALPPAPGRRAAEPALDRRGLPLRAEEEGAARHLPRRHERDGLRHAERALSRRSREPLRRRRRTCSA